MSRFTPGPSKATHPTTDHRHGYRVFGNKFKKAGEFGWCQMHMNVDVPATTWAVYSDPRGPEYRVTVCDDCLRLKRIRQK